MTAYRDSPPLRQRIVWCKPADETVVAVVVCAFLASLAGLATAQEIASRAWLAAIALALPGALLIALGARFVNRDVAVLIIEGSTITSRDFLSRRRRARAQLDAASEIKVAEAVVVGFASGGTDSQTSVHIATEHEVRVGNDHETAVLVGIHSRPAADEIANWIRAARDRSS